MKKASRGKQAALWLADQSGDVGLTEAGDQFGISREAVRQAWGALCLGETPREKMRRQLCAVVVDLSRSGKTAQQIEDLTGVQWLAITRWCREAGVDLRRGPSGCCPADPVAVAAGLEVVRAGGSVAEGASAAGVQYAAFHRHVKRANIIPSRFDQRKRSLGRSAQAAQLVEREGVSAGDAAQIFEISPGSVRSYLKRHAP